MNRNLQHQRTLGTTGIKVSAVAMGCWPIAGMTSLDVNQSDSLATLRAAFTAGINFFDTAYCYGIHGESERLIGQALGKERDQIVIATKGGVHWDPQRVRQFAADPQTLRQQCDSSLQRLGTDYVDLLYLHAPDPRVPVAESAGALRDLIRVGKTRSVGVSNFSVEQLDAFQAVCPVTAVQPHYNMLQREIEAEIIPWCQRHQASVIVYWPLMKGLLAGRLARDHVFAPGDGRAKYPMFQGQQWQRNQDLVDELRRIANAIGKTVAQLVVAWTITQPGIAVALCGAKRASQILETAGALEMKLADETLAEIDAALKRRGEAVSQPAI